MTAQLEDFLFDRALSLSPDFGSCPITGSCWVCNTTVYGCRERAIPGFLNSFAYYQCSRVACGKYILPLLEYTEVTSMTQIRWNDKEQKNLELAFASRYPLYDLTKLQSLSVKLLIRSKSVLSPTLERILQGLVFYIHIFFQLIISGKKCIHMRLPSDGLQLRKMSKIKNELKSLGPVCSRRKRKDY